MTESNSSLGSQWRTGMHPGATGLRVESLGRVHLQLGEALRIEMTDADRSGEDVVHLQYYIATELGPWAIWFSGPRSDADAAESNLREVTPPFEDAQG